MASTVDTLIGKCNSVCKQQIFKENQASALVREPYLYLDENTVVKLIEKLFSIKNFILLILEFFQGLEKIPFSVDLIGSFYFEVNVVSALL